MTTSSHISEQDFYNAPIPEWEFCFEQDLEKNKWSIVSAGIIDLELAATIFVQTYMSKNLVTEIKNKMQPETVTVIGRKAGSTDLARLDVTITPRALIKLDLAAKIIP